MDNKGINQQNTFQNYVYIEISQKEKKYVRCNYNTLTIEIGTFVKDKFIDKEFFVVHRKVFDCCIDKIYIVENPLTKEEYFEVHFISRIPTEPCAILKGNLREIWKEMKAKTTYIMDTSIGLTILTIVFNHYLQQGWYEGKKGGLPPGFYYFDNQLVAFDFEEKKFTKEDLQRAAIFLNEYIMSHSNPTLIASIIRAGLLLPFSFAQKQMFDAGKLRKRMKYFFLYDETKLSGIRTAILLQRLWGWNYEISYANFNTESRAGKHLSSSTFPIVVYEVSKNLERNAVREMLSFSQENLIARIILNGALKQIYYPAFAPVIMISNSYFLKDSALLERFIVFRFRKSDKISGANRTRYKRENFHILEPLGQFVWRYIKEHGLRDDYIEYATEILKAFYREAEIEAEWLLKEFKHDTVETEEEQKYNRESEFYNAVIKFFSHNVKQKEYLDHIRSIYYALKALEFGRRIWIDSKDYVNISKDFLHELRKFDRCEIRNLKELANITGWKKLVKRYKYTQVWVVRTSVMDFFYRLNYIPKFLDTAEFKRWLDGKYVVEPH